MALDSHDTNLIMIEGLETRKELSNLTKELIRVNKTLNQILEEVKKINTPRPHIGPM